MRIVDLEAGPGYVVQTRDDACWLWDWLASYRASGQWLAWDGETNGLDPWDRDFTLRCAQMSDGQVSVIIPAERVDGDLRMLDVIRECTRAHPAWVAHYAENDIRFAERGAPGSVRLDSIAPHFYDTQPLLAWYDPRTVTGKDIFTANGCPAALPNGLKPSVHRILGTDVLTRAEQDMTARFRELAPVGSRNVKAAKSWGFANIDTDDEIYLRYAGLDALCEMRLWQHMAAECILLGQWPEILASLRRQWHIDLMTFRGMLTDSAYARWLDAHYVKIIQDNAAMLDAAGVAPSGMGPSIGKSFEALGIRSTRTTPKGAPSWDRVMIDSIIDNEHMAITPEHHQAVEVAKALKLVRQATKFRPAYIKPMLDAEARDGRIHCSMREIGAVTSRMSAARPPVQQMPKRSSQLIRAAFVAPPGWVIVSCDLKQGEPRTMAALSGDKRLQDAIESGDINSRLAALTYGDRFVDDPKVFKDASTASYDLRDRGKRGFLADCYGVGLRKLASSQLLKVPTDQARGIQDAWHAEYQQLNAYRDKCNNQPAVVLDNGWIVPLWDRYTLSSSGMHLLPNAKPSRLGLNGATQGNQAVLLRRSLDRIIDWGWSWALMMLVHDEAVCCVPEEYEEKCRLMLEAAMTMEFRGFPIRCDATIDGQSWMPQKEFNAQMAAELAAGTET